MYFRGFLMVDIADLRGPWVSLEALRGVLGGPGSSRVGFGRARGGPEEKGTAFGAPRRGTMFCNDVRKLGFFQSEVLGASGILSWEGVFRVLWVHGTPQESAFTFFWAPGGSFGAAKVRTMTIFYLNPTLVLTVLFFVF